MGATTGLARSRRWSSRHTTRRPSSPSPWDTQAGLKGLSREAWERLAPVLRVDGFAFDVELLARAGQAGLRIVETAVAFRYVDPTTVVMLRHGRQMLVEVLRLRRALRRYPVGAHPGSSSVPVADRL